MSTTTSATPLTTTKGFPSSWEYHKPSSLITSLKMLDDLSAPPTPIPAPKASHSHSHSHSLYTEEDTFVDAREGGPEDAILSLVPIAPKQDIFQMLAKHHAEDFGDDTTVSSTEHLSWSSEDEDNLNDNDNENQYQYQYQNQNQNDTASASTASSTTVFVDAQSHTGQDKDQLHRGRDQEAGPPHGNGNGNHPLQIVQDTAMGLWEGTKQTPAGLVIHVTEGVWGHLAGMVGHHHPQEEDVNDDDKIDDKESTTDHIDAVPETLPPTLTLEREHPSSATVSVQSQASNALSSSQHHRSREELSAVVSHALSVLRFDNEVDAFAFDPVDHPTTTMGSQFPYFSSPSSRQEHPQNVDGAYPHDTINTETTITTNTDHNSLRRRLELTPSKNNYATPDPVVRVVATEAIFEDEDGVCVTLTPTEEDAWIDI